MLVEWDCAADAGLKEVRKTELNFTATEIRRSGDGRRLAVWSRGQNHKVTILDASTGAVLQVIKSPAELGGVALAEDGARLFAVSGGVRFVRLRTANRDVDERFAGLFFGVRLSQRQ